MAKKKPLPTPKIDPERETRAILEGMSNDIKIVAEGHGIIIRRLDNVESELTSVKGAVMEVDDRLKKVEHKLDTVDHRLGAVENKLDNVGHKLDTVAAAYGTRIISLEAKVR